MCKWATWDTCYKYQRQILFGPLEWLLTQRLYSFYSYKLWCYPNKCIFLEGDSITYTDGNQERKIAVKKGTIVNDVDDKEITISAKDTKSYSYMVRDNKIEFYSTSQTFSYSDIH